MEGKRGKEAITMICDICITRGELLRAIFMWSMMLITRMMVPAQKCCAGKFLRNQTKSNVFQMKSL